MKERAGSELDADLHLYLSLSHPGILIPMVSPRTPIPVRNASVKNAPRFESQKLLTSAKPPPCSSSSIPPRNKEVQMRHIPLLGFGGTQVFPHKFDGE
jgi:hypothetical protein